MLGAIYEDVMISSYEQSNQKYIDLDKYNLFTQLHQFASK